MLRTTLLMALVSSGVSAGALASDIAEPKEQPIDPAPALRMIEDNAELFSSYEQYQEIKAQQITGKTVQSAPSLKLTPPQSVSAE